MKKPWNKLDRKYTKVCLYAIVSVILTLGVIVFLYVTRGFWVTVWGVIRAITRPVIIGGIICYLLSPVVNWLEKRLTKKKERGWVRPVSVLVCVLLVIGIIGLLVMLIAMMMYRSFKVVSLVDLKAFLTTVQAEIEAILEAVQLNLADAGISMDKIGQIAGVIIGALQKAAMGLVFGIVFSIYFLIDGKRISRYGKRAFRLIAGEQAWERLSSFGKDADRVFSGYFRGQFLDGMLVGSVTSIAMLIIGVPSAVVVGMMTGFGNMIPYMGPIVGYLMLGLVCVSASAWGKLLTGAIVLAVIMIIDGNVVNPRMVGRNVKVHPLLVVVSLLAGATIGGLVGMIVAVPTAALIKTYLDRYLDKKEELKIAAQSAENVPVEGVQAEPAVPEEKNNE